MPKPKRKDAEGPCWRQRQQAAIASEASAIWKVVKPYPSTALIPLLSLMLLLSVGVWGVLQVRRSSVDSFKGEVWAHGSEVAAWYREQVLQAYGPAKALNAVVLNSPQYDPGLLDRVGPALFKMVGSDSYISLQLAPNGVIRSVLPAWEHHEDLGFDMFASDEDQAASAVALATKSLAVVGPLELGHAEGLWLQGRVPIFIDNVTHNASFGAPDAMNPHCGSSCYDESSGSKFWGFSVALVSLDAISSANGSLLRNLEHRGFRYELVADVQTLSAGNGSANNTDGSVVVAATKYRPRDPIEVLLKLPGMQDWTLRVGPAQGWSPSWSTPMLACVVVVALVVSLMEFFMLVSRRQHKMLLEALLPRDMIDDLRRDGSQCLGKRSWDAVTPAAVLLKLLSEMLSDQKPDLREVLFVRQAVAGAADIYQPLNLSNTMREANLDEDVTKALVHTLGGRYSLADIDGLSDVMLRAEEEGGGRSEEEGGRRFSAMSVVSTQPANDCTTLEGALSFLLAPQPTVPVWQEGGDDNVSCATSEARSSSTSIGVSATTPHHAQMQHIARRPSGIARAGSSPMLSPHDVPAPPHRGQRTESGDPRTPSRLQNFTVGNAAAAGGAPSAQQLPGSPVMQAERTFSCVASTISSSAVVVIDESRPSGNAMVLAPPQATTPTRPGPAAPSALQTSISRLRRRSSLLQAGASGIRFDDTVDVPFAAGPPSHANSGQWLDATAVVGMAGGDSKRALVPSQSRRSSAGLAVMGMPSKKQLPPLSPLTPPPPVLEDVERVLALADEWQFDAWRLAEATQGHPLSSLAFYLIHRQGLMERLRLKPVRLARLLRHLEAGYPDNPYHNATHAADVVQTLHALLHGAQLTAHYLDSPLGLLAAYFAAVIHDFGHPGLTNDFLIATSDPLAQRYNDRAPLENHHCAAALAAARRTEMDFMESLSVADKAAFRKQVIEMVLATDMKQHFALLGQFNTAHRLAANNGSVSNVSTPKAAGPAHAQAPAPVAGSPNAPARTPSRRHGLPSPSAAIPAPMPLDETERLLSLQLALKLSDIGHLGEELSVHKRWVAALEEEFFTQGDRERAAGLPISPLFERGKQGVSKSQVGFYEFIALPLAQAVTAAFPGARPLLDGFTANCSHWRAAEIVAEAEAAPRPAAPKTIKSASQVVPSNV